jgi:hypothetical protein
LGQFHGGKEWVRIIRIIGRKRGRSTRIKKEDKEINSTSIMKENKGKKKIT